MEKKLFAVSLLWTRHYASTIQNKLCSQVVEAVNGFEALGMVIEHFKPTHKDYDLALWTINEFEISKENAGVAQ